MSYDMYTEEESSKKSKKKDKKNEGSKIDPFYIHLGIIVAIIIGLIFFFTSDFSFDFSSEEKVEVVLVGEVDSFRETFSGDLNVYSGLFNLETKNSQFDGSSTTFEFEGFNGEVFLKNNSIVFDGNATKISYGKNVINLNGENFLLVSRQKTTFDTFVPTINLTVTDGRIKLGEELNYEFEDTKIILSNFNASIGYDGVFSFTGPTQSFSLTNQEQGLNINYFQN